MKKDEESEEETSIFFLSHAFLSCFLSRPELRVYIDNT